MPKTRAKDVYEDKTLIDMAHRIAAYRSSAGFLDDFPLIPVSPRTLQSVHGAALELSAGHRREDDLSPLEKIQNVWSETVFQIIKALDLRPEAYNLYPWLNRSLNGIGAIDAVSNLAAARGMVGDYKYCRPSPSKSGLDVGGLRFFVHYDVPRFIHFFDFKDLQRLREREVEEGIVQPSDTGDAFNEYLSRLVRPHHPPHDGSGFFFVSSGQIVVLALNPANIRCSLGVPLNASELQNKEVRLTVSGRARDGGYFAAKAVMFHHSHRKFDTKRLKASEVETMLGVNNLEEAILRY